MIVEDRSEETVLDAVMRLLAQVSEDLGDEDITIESIGLVVVAGGKPMHVCYRGTGDQESQAAGIAAIKRIMDRKGGKLCA